MVRFRINKMRLTDVFAAGAGFGLALGAALLLFPAAAHAGDDDVSIDQKFMRGIMEGLGLRRDGEEVINYRERSPLVIPPSRELPPPERSDGVTANNPAWPKDVDVERRKTRAAIEKNRNISDEREREQNPLGRRLRVAAVGLWQPIASVRTGFQGRQFVFWWQQEGRVGEIHGRTTARFVDRSSTRLSNALARPAVWYRQSSSPEGD